MASASERNPIRNRGLQLIPYGSHEEWLKIRRGYIGGSDAGAIVGMNPYSTPMTKRAMVWPSGLISREKKTCMISGRAPGLRWMMNGCR